MPRRWGFNPRSRTASRRGGGTVACRVGGGDGVREGLDAGVLEEGRDFVRCIRAVSLTFILGTLSLSLKVVDDVCGVEKEALCGGVSQR